MVIHLHIFLRNEKNKPILCLKGGTTMGKKSKSKRNMIESKDAAQPNNGKERETISKVSRELEESER